MRKQRRMDQATRRVQARDPILRLSIPYAEIVAQLDKSSAPKSEERLWLR